ncbi:cupredoxin domain-containing protein [Candidatus Pelagibacter sp.]|nr:cupredoxin domain-containing protein [Candidatus Pelagibacter sp.]
MIKKIYILLLFIVFSFFTQSYADTNMMSVGSEGKSVEVTRVIKIKMYDNYFEPNSFNFKAEETVRFEVENFGELVHEFNIANAMMHKKHQPEMQKMVENEILLGDSIDRKKMAKMDKSMRHQHSNSVLLEPKEKKDLIWKFSKAQNIEIACNVPGHYDVGMIAKVKITQ